MDDKHIRVLLVEDNPNDVNLIQKILSEDSRNVFEISHAAQLSKSLEFLKSNDIDIILLDMGLPDSHGIETLIAVLSQNGKIPVIIQAYSSDEELAKRAVKVGAQDYLIKERMNCYMLGQSVRYAIECKMMNEEILESKKRFKAFYQDDPIPIFTWQKRGEDFFLIDFNTAAIQVTDKKAQNYLGKSAIKLSKNQPEILEYMRQCFAEQSVISREIVSNHFCPGKHLLVHFSCLEPDLIIVRIEDLTERKKMEEKIINSERYYRLLSENVSDFVWVLDLEGMRLSYCSPSVRRLFGYTEEEFLSKNINETMTQDSYKLAIQTLEEEMDAENKKSRDPSRSRLMEVEIIRKDGSSIWVEMSATFIRNAEGKAVSSIIGISRDISKRKLAEEALLKNEEKYRTILENIEDGCYEVDLYGNFTFINNSMSRILGYSKEDLLGMNYKKYTDKENAENIFREYNKIFNAKENPRQRFEWQLIAKNEDAVYIEQSISLQKDSYGKIIGFQGIVRDVTERKKSEDALRKSETKYRQLIENAHEGIFQSTVEGRHITVNQAFANILGYDSPEEVVKNITDIAHQIYVNPEDRTKILQTIDKEGSVKGYETEFYRKDGSKIWVSINMHAVRDDQGKILYYQGIDQDITDKKRIETERQENIERLRSSLGATINAMAVTVETRDPYTAGHQRRVADLARAIASEMNLSSDQVDGIRMASMIHDIGKISIPSEILAKPTKLTELEFNLIKTHSQSGYDILKNINFPSPVAQIILEHHERVNGSGYPNGLKGDQILLESQVLAVADVIEAMASYRPYRPSLGIETALKEIEKNKGILYNNIAVDVCLKLFREKDFQIQGFDDFDPREKDT